MLLSNPNDIFGFFMIPKFILSIIYFSILSSANNSPIPLSQLYSISTLNVGVVDLIVFFVLSLLTFSLSSKSSIASEYSKLSALFLSLLFA